MKTPKAPEQTPQQRAFEDAQNRALSKEITEENRRRKALVRGSLGASSLLSGLNADGSPASGNGPGPVVAPKTPTTASVGASRDPRMQGPNGGRANSGSSQGRV